MLEEFNAIHGSTGMELPSDNGERLIRYYHKFVQTKWKIQCDSDFSTSYSL